MDRWKRKRLKLPFRDLEAATQMPHPNVPAALDTRDHPEAGRSAQFSSFIGRDHVGGTDALCMRLAVAS